MYQDDEDEDNEASEEENSVIEDPATHAATNYICDRPEVFGTVSMSCDISGIKSDLNLDSFFRVFPRKFSKLWI